MASKYRDMKAAEIPEGVPFHIKLNGTPYENSGKWGPWWKWPIEIESDNPAKQGQYETEFAYMTVGDAELQGALSAAYQSFGVQDGDRVKANIYITRGQGDKGATFTVTQANGAAAPQTASPARATGGRTNGKANPIRHALGMAMLTQFVRQQVPDIAGPEAEAIAVSAGIYAEKNGFDLLGELAKAQRAIRDAQPPSEGEQDIIDKLDLVPANEAAEAMVGDEGTGAAAGDCPF